MLCGMRSLARGVVVAALLVCGLCPPAVGQESPSGLEVRLVAQPIWHEPGDRLGLRLRLINDGDTAVSGFIVRVGVSGRTGSRSELHATFDPEPLSFEASSFSIEEHSDRSLEPGATLELEIDEPIEILSSMANAEDGGVYPLRIGVVDAASFEEIGAATTHLLYYPEPPEVPLNLVLALPLGTTPAMGPADVFARDDEDRWPLEEAVGAEGWLTGMVEAIDLATDRGLRLGIAPIPRSLEELRAMAAGYRRADPSGSTETVAPSDRPSRAAQEVIDRIRSLVRPGRNQPLQTPYSFPDLTALTEQEDFISSFVSQIDLGREVASDVLGIELNDRWLFPPGGRVDLATLDDLRLAEGRFDRTFFGAESFEGLFDPALEGCPLPGLSFTCTVTVPGEQGETRGYIVDSDLQARVTALQRTGTRSDLQRLFAETAMIREEQPGVANRTVQVTLSAPWEPGPGLSKKLFLGLARAPWLRTVTPARGLTLVEDTHTSPVVQNIDPLPNRPDDAFWDELVEAEGIVDQYASIVGSAEPLQRVQRLRRDLLVAQSRLWWRSDDLATRGAEYAQTARDEAQDEMDKIRLEGVEEITFTARQGEIQLQLVNGTGYPVTLDVEMDSPDLELDRRTISETFDSQTRVITLQAEAQTSGIFTATARVLTPSGFEIHSKAIEVRSTQFNQVAVALTLGALAFLIVFYLVRVFRPKKVASTEDDR